MQPSQVPEKVALIVDDAPPPLIRSGAGVIGSIGVPGGRPDGVIGSVLSALPAPAPPARAEPVKVETAEEPKPVRRVRVGGEVSPPVLIHRVNPLYPALARQVRASGEVRLRCVIGVDGRLTSLSLVSGHPLLAPAAMEAVKQWRYRPTRLNGEPVEVAMVVSVHFRLGR
jgi:protein TonB